MGECVVIESIAEIVGIVNVACICLIVGGNGVLVLDEVLRKIASKLKEKTNIRPESGKCIKVQTQSELIRNKKLSRKSLKVLCEKIRNLLLVEKFVDILNDHKIKKLKAYNTIKKLNVCEDSIAYTRAYYVQKYSLVVWIIFIMNIVSLMIVSYTDCTKKETSPNVNVYDIIKPNYGEPAKRLKFNVEIMDENGVIKKSVLDIDVEPNRLNIFDEAKLINEAKEEIYKKALGKNKSYDKVYYDLDLISKVSVDSNITVTWKTGESSAIDYKGAINNDYIKKEENQGSKVTITAIIKYFNREYEYPIELKVYKKREDEETKVLNAVKEEVNILNKEHNRNGILTLPETVAGYHIKYYEKKEDKETSIWYMCMMIGIVCIYVVIKYKEQDFKKDIKNKEEQLIMYYSEIVTKIKMLVIAGLTIEGALQKICEDYEKQKTVDNINYAYEELLYTYKDIEVGTSTIQAFERMGRRIGIGPYIRLSSLIIQNIKNGTDSFIESLDVEVKTLERKREEMYIKKGGELGAKLLFPMMLLMGITLLIVMLPALLTI